MATTLRLAALSGEPLSDPMVRDTVIAAAHALAERHGIQVGRIGVDLVSLTLELDIDRIGALGFGAELRRATNACYEGKFHDGPLWGTPPPEDGAGGALDDFL